MTRSRVETSSRRGAGPSLLIAALGGALACGGSARSGGAEPATLPPESSPKVEPLRIEEPEGHHAREGFVEMAPPVRLPTTHDRRDLIRTWVRFPTEPPIRTEYLEAQGRYTIRAPEGTESDRVEYMVLGDPSLGERIEPERTILDIRGLGVGDEGPSRFRVLRPLGGEPHGPLAGYEWGAFDEAAQDDASDALAALVRRARRPVDRAPLSGDGLERFVRLNHCARCHTPNEPLRLVPDSDGVHRATDATGCYTLLMMLAESVPVSDARPLDLNVQDPFVRFRCGEEVFEGRELGRPPECADGRAPLAFRDVRAGLDAGDEYTEKVCDGRRYIHEHLDACGRQVFHAAFAECGLARRAPDAGCPPERGRAIQ